MVTISNIVQKLVNDRVYIQEAMIKGVISYGSLAKHLSPEITSILGKSIKTHAVEMALRRYADTLKEIHKTIPFDYSSEIVLKTDICDISVASSPTLFSKLKQLDDIIDFERGDFLNIIHGRREVSIVTNERYQQQLLSLLKKEKILNVELNLVSLTLTYSKQFFYTPGVIFTIVRNIAWENLNIFEIVSTSSELTLILSKKDAVRGYKALEKLVEES